jgi:hypothetical protein
VRERGRRSGLELDWESAGERREGARVVRFLIPTTATGMPDHMTETALVRVLILASRPR